MQITTKSRSDIFGVTLLWTIGLQPVHRLKLAHGNKPEIVPFQRRSDALRNFNFAAHRIMFPIWTFVTILKVLFLMSVAMSPSVCNDETVWHSTNFIRISRKDISAECVIAFASHFARSIHSNMQNFFLAFFRSARPLPSPFPRQDVGMNGAPCVANNSSSCSYSLEQQKEEDELCAAQSAPGYCGRGRERGRLCGGRARLGPSG